MGASDGLLRAIDRFTGTVLWAFPTRGNVDSSAALTSDGRIVFGSQDGVIRMLRPDGTLDWEIPTGGRFLGFTPDGRLAFSTKVGSEVVCAGRLNSPAIAADGTLYVPTLEGRSLEAARTRSKGMAPGGWSSCWGPGERAARQPGG